jgi:hypothetical protein
VILFDADGHYVQPDLAVRVCSHPGCDMEVWGGFSCIAHRHYADAELRLIEAVPEPGVKV